MKIEQIKKDIIDGQQMLFTKDDVLRIIEEVATTYNEPEPVDITDIALVEKILEKNGFKRERAYLNSRAYYIGESSIKGCSLYIMLL